MRNDTPLVVVWRRKWIVLGTFLVFVVATGVVSKTLEKVYETNSKLLIALPAANQTFDAVQASQAVARSYAEVIDSPNFADQVARQLVPPGGDVDALADELDGATSFEPLPETQLLEIHAEDPSPERAKQIADAYARVFILAAEGDLADTTKATVTLADAAPLPDQPARPKPTLYVLVASILGLALGLALAFLRDRMDRRLRTSEDVESRFDPPVLARIPRRGRSEASVSAFREAHRILRTNLQFASGAARLRSIAVLSGGEGEGKTTTVAQIAIASAEVGEHVIVVEADLRRPGLQQEVLPGTEPLRPGLTNYLVEVASTEEIIYPTSRPGLDIVPSGPLPPSPSALLEARRGIDAVTEFAGRADLVIVDCPPLSVGADASIISGWVDGVIVVVDLESSTDRTVRDALRQLEAVQAPVLGLVLNRDSRAEVSRYEYYVAAGAEAEDDSSRSGRDPQRVKS